MQLPTSILTKQQTKTYGPKIYTENDQVYKITVTVRYDDSCSNGCNLFSITASQDRQTSTGIGIEDSCGCMHATIAKHFPELAPYIKWHLTYSDGPMHYIANTVYHVGEGKPRELDAARRVAIWPDATDEELIAPGLEERLQARLPGLMLEFKTAMEELGFTY